MTSLYDHATYTEIKSQTDAWAQALGVTRTSSLPDAKKYEQVIFTGCGSVILQWKRSFGGIPSTALQ